MFCMHKIKLIPTLEKFLVQYSSSDQPFLLALSGGTDSLALFYALLACQKKIPITFHIAHVDHGWRTESQEEAQHLKELAHKHSIPFHIHCLNCEKLMGNLEEACRKERYKFFAQLYEQFDYQGVLLGHHCDDQVETVLKRVFEGAHWSCLSGLKAESYLNGMRLLRPLLNLTKKEIVQNLQEQNRVAFVDSSNFDQRFLRARMRLTLLPWLNQTFGKNIQSSLVHLSEEMQEMDEYFEKKMSPVVDTMQIGPFGTYLDISPYFFSSITEIKYLVRLFCKKNGFSLSREQYQLAAKALLENKANQTFECMGKKLHVDRKHLFLLKEKQNNKKKWTFFITKNTGQQVEVLSWKQHWQGTCSIILPEEVYQIMNRIELGCHTKSLNKWWGNQYIPVCIRDLFPIVCHGHEIVHEFLTGKRFLNKQINSDDIKSFCITLKFSEL